VDIVRERDVLAGCLKLLALRGIPAWRANSGAARLRNANGASRFVQFGVRGQADILGVLPPDGRFLAVETKAPRRGRLSADQKAFLEMIRRAGGVAIVAHDAAELATELDLLSVRRIA
jgi:hypothetical protein